jgi:hypothetical protein
MALATQDAQLCYRTAALAVASGTHQELRVQAFSQGLDGKTK